METAEHLEALVLASRKRQQGALRRNLVINVALVLGGVLWVSYTLARISREQARLDELTARTELADQRRSQLAKDVGALEAQKRQLEQEKFRLEETNAGLEVTVTRQTKAMEQVGEAAERGSLVQVKQVVAREGQGQGAALWQAGYAAFQRGDKQAAQTFYERAIKAQPDYAPPYSSLGRMRYEAGDIDGAEALYTQALARVPTYAPALHNLSLVAYQRKDYKRAWELNDRALAARPGFKNALDMRTGLQKVAPR